jgi:hypothetical protein
VVFAGLFAVSYLGSLDDHVRRDVRVTLDRFCKHMVRMVNPLKGTTTLTQSKTMVFPGDQVLGAVDGYTTTLLLALDLVFTMPPEELGGLVPKDATSMGIDELAIGVLPSASGNNPPGLNSRGAQQQN